MGDGQKNALLFFEFFCFVMGPDFKIEHDFIAFAADALENDLSEMLIVMAPSVNDVSDVLHQCLDFIDGGLQGKKICLLATRNLRVVMFSID